MLIPRAPNDEVPLTFCQLWTWNVLELDRNKSTRSIATAIRLLGPTDAQSLRTCFRELIARHEALRTRIVVKCGIPMQEIDAAIAEPLEVIDLRMLPVCRRQWEAKCHTEELVHESYPLHVGPLFAARLLVLSESERVLVVAIDHIVSDYASLGILLKELWILYAQATHGQSPSLPKIAIQFADFSVWILKDHVRWMSRHGVYWRERLAGARHLDLFAGAGRMTEVPSIRMATFPVQLSLDVTTKLRELSRKQRTTLVMSALTAYVASMFRWCEQPDLVVTFVAMARLNPEITRTIGYFGGASLYLRVDLGVEDTFVDLLTRVSREYATAFQHADSGRIAVQTPKPEFRTNPRFNWIPQAFKINPTGATHGSEGDQAIRLEQSPFELTPRDDFDARGGAPELVLSDTPAGITGVFWYRADYAPRSSVERFVREFQAVAEQMATDSMNRVTAVSRAPSRAVLCLKNDS